MKEWFEQNEEPVNTMYSIMEVPDKSFVKVFTTCSEIINQVSWGEELRERVTRKGVKEIVDVKITNKWKKLK